MQVNAYLCVATVAGFTACSLFAPAVKAGPSAAQRWNDAFGAEDLDTWESDQPVPCRVTPRNFRAVVKNVLSDLNIPMINEREFNKKGTPQVVVGIRCVPMHRRLDSQDNGSEVGEDDNFEITQFYVQLLEPQTGVRQFRVLRRSAQHAPRSLRLQPLEQPEYGRQTAKIIMEKLVAALKGAPTYATSGLSETSDSNVIHSSH